MIKNHALRARITLLVLLQSIVFGGMSVTSSFARGAESDATIKPVTVVEKGESQGQSKLALAQSTVEVRGTEAPLKGKAVKVKPSLPTYKEIENYSYDMGGNLPGAGI